MSGIHKRLNTSLWRADSFNQEFADHQGDLLNCRDQVVSNSGIKEFWDGFEDINSKSRFRRLTLTQKVLLCKFLSNGRCVTCSERPKSKVGEPMVYRLKDWPSGEEFMALMPSRYKHASTFCFHRRTKGELGNPFCPSYECDSLKNVWSVNFHYGVWLQQGVRIYRWVPTLKSKILTLVLARACMWACVY